VAERKMPPNAHKFKPGQSGNPGGRPKNQVSLSAHLKRVMLECRKGSPVAGGEKGQTNYDAVARKLILCAIQGRPWAQRIVWDRVEGRVPVILKHGTDGDNPPELHLIITEELAGRVEGVPAETPGE
jgi:hypothetical protein